MDDSYVKGFTSSTKFGENNENYDVGSPKLPKSKKAVMKHFMSPTISAATKATSIPRKKILAERNEAFTLINSPKPPNLDSRSSSIVSARSTRSCCNSDCDEDDPGQNNFDVDSSLKKPYDPLTNYLSPRPKYLRYNPNRKRRIFLYGESEITERNDVLDVVSTSSSFESQKVVEEKSVEEGSVKEEDEESEKFEGDPNDYDDDDDVEDLDEIEEFEEEKCWSLFGFLKFLLVLGSLFVSTTYICSMNAPDPSLIQEAISRNGFVNQSQTHEVFTRKEYLTSEFEFLGGIGEESHISLLDVTQKDMDSVFVEVGISEVNRDEKGLLASTARSPEVIEVKNEKSEDVYNNDGSMSKVEASDAFQWAEVTESETNTDGEVAASKAEASSDQLLGSDSNASVKDREMGKNQEGLDQLQGAETTEVTESFREDLFSEIEASTDLNAENEQIESEEIKLQLEVAALAVSVTIVAALGMFYHSRRKNSKEDFLPTQKNSSKEASLPIETQQLNAEPLESAHQLQNNNVICSVEEEKVKTVESFASPPIPVPSMKVQEFSRQSQAPIVELLGELVIGEESSSFVRSRRMTKMADSEERNASNSLSTQMMISRSKTSLVHNQVYSPQLDLSTADSSSQRKKNVVKKEEGKGGEATSYVTPVRRSSRIRNKAMSP